MKPKIFKQISYMILLLLSVNLVPARNMPIQELIDSYDYSYSGGTLNATSQTDYMTDQNSNGINDTLIINITTDAATAGIYKFIVEILDKNGVLVNETSVAINSSNPSLNVAFQSYLLSKAKFNYSIKINDVNDNLVFRKLNIESQTYSKYETGTNATRITDEIISNNFIRINLTINSTQAITANITVTLAYNSSTVSKTTEKSLSNGVQVASIDFDNETIKSTHYIGSFTLDAIVVGTKIFDFNQNTSIYSYEDFAKTSYIKSIADGRIDTNANNLSEFLEINFTIAVKTANTYNISYDLYDEFGNFVMGYNTARILSLGNQTVQTLINGSEIYKTKINGPYVLSFAKLAIGNDTKDIIFNAHLTNQTFYTDYERPLLPDLKVEMAVVFNEATNITNITLNISNIGQIPAFNVVLDVFDNTNYTNNRSLSYLNNNETVSYEFNITNSSNASLYTLIADFDNLVDEANESNNIVQNSQPQIVSLKIDSLTEMYSNGAYKIFEFVILNDGEAAVTDIQWKFDAGNGDVINSTMNFSSLAVNERAFVYIEYNYSGSGNFNVRANATGLSQSTILSASLSSTVTLGNATSLNVYDFSVLYQNATLVVFGFSINNTGNVNLSNLNWSLNTRAENIFANELLGLNPNESIFVFAEYLYPSGGEYNVIASATDGTNSDSESLSVNVKAVEVANLSVLNISGTEAIFEFVIGNRMSANLTGVNWTFDAKNGNIINSTMAATLQPSEQMFVYIEYNFTTAGTYNVNATARNGSLSDSKNLTVIVI